ncbi:MAG: DUF202 domain-containing protein [Actinomycetota bacterium]
MSDRRRLRADRRARPARPARVFDRMLQHERTALAWERTAIAVMVTGVLFARQAATIHESLGALGVAQVVLGGVVLIWAGKHYDDLHAPLRAGQSPVHPGAARIVGLASIGFIGAALVITVAALVF